MRSCWARCSRSRLPSASSTYRVAAVAGGPRCSDRARTTTRYSNGPRRIRSRSPTASSFARLARAPPTSTLPPPMAAAARARVLKKRAAHNHRSSRTRDPSDMAPPLPAGYGPRATPGMRIMGTAAPPKPFFVQSTMLARCATRPPAVPARRVAASQALRAVTLGAAAASVLLACGTPGVRGVAGTAPAPNVLWTPPRQPAAAPAAAPPQLPADLAGRIAQLKLTDVIDIALRNNTATSAAWADARAAAATYGAAKGQYYPTIAVNGTATAIRRTVAAAGQQAVKQQFYGPAVTLSWLLFDFGGRSGAIGQARAALLAADWTHNATLQSVVLDVQQAYFLYLGAKALLDAQLTTLREAQTNLEAAEQRHRVGLATIADVLQARTALSQARLALEATQGALQTTRGALALSMGLPANIPYDLEVIPDTTLPLGVVEGVDTLIAQALRARPDLAAQRAQVDQARARVSVARSQALPTLALGGTAGETYFINPPAGSATSGNSYNATLTLSFPLFSGGTQIYTVKAALAAARAQAIQARLSWNTALAQLAHDVGILGLDGSSPLQLQADTTGAPK